MNLQNNQLLLFGVVLSLALVLGANAIGSAVKQLKSHSFDVTGAASKVVASNQAVWRIEAKGHAGSQAGAYQAMQGTLKKLQAFLTSNGLEAKELSLGGISKEVFFVRDGQGYTTTTPESYDVAQTLEVRTMKVEKIQELTSKVGELLNDGATFNANNPEYQYSKLDDIKLEMIGLATKNAKERAARMAQNAGNHVGPLVSASTGVFQITPEFSTDVSDWGVNDTTTIRKKVTAVVNVGFALE